MGEAQKRGSGGEQSTGISQQVKVGRTPRGSCNNARHLRRVLRRVLETTFKKVLRRVLRRCLDVGFRGRKGSEKGFLKGF